MLQHNQADKMTFNTTKLARSRITGKNRRDKTRRKYKTTKDTKKKNREQDRQEKKTNEEKRERIDYTKKDVTERKKKHKKRIRKLQKQNKERNKKCNLIIVHVQKAGYSQQYNEGNNSQRIKTARVSVSYLLNFLAGLASFVIIIIARHGASLVILVC